MDAFVSLREFIVNWKTTFVAVAILFSGTLYAQTPDDETSTVVSHHGGFENV